MSPGPLPEAVVSATTSSAQRNASAAPAEALVRIPDDLHATVVDETCREDAELATRGERRWTRFLVPHEMCPPGVCLVWPAGTLVEVVVLGAGIRMRRPFVAEPGAA
jgi:hypothetical protein